MPPLNFGGMGCQGREENSAPPPQRSEICVKFSFFTPFLAWNFVDDRQITHLICARPKYDPYDFFRGCFGPASFLFLV